MVSEQDFFLTVNPKNELLAKHIKYYYFHTSHDANFSTNVVYHPHYVTGLNIYKHTRVEWNDYGRTYIPNTSKKLSIVFTINKKLSKEVRLRGKFDKIGIVFTPLGINHFIKPPLSDIIDDGICHFDYYGKALHEVAQAVYHEKNIENKRDLLDNFFTKQYVGFEDSRLLKAVQKIYTANDSIKTQDMANSLGISRETLLRIFKKHLCFSVEEFKSVVRFRRALEYYEENAIKPKLTHVAMDNQYYDQANFVKHFRKVTGSSPKNFFSSLRNISNKGTYWTFKD